MNEDERSKLISQGWRQGTLIQNIVDDNFKSHAHFDLKENDIYLIISQTCDLVQPDFNNEPFFEVLRLSSIDSQPANEYLGGKNSRELHFHSEINGVSHTFRTLPYERFFVARQLLKTHTPEGSLSENTTEMVVAWLTKRLTRKAFPDEFDKRWKERLKQIERVIKRLKLVSDIYINISPFDEVDKDTEYEMHICLLMKAEHYDNPTLYKEYSQHKKSLEDQFNKCPGIDLQIIELKSDAEITLKEIQELSRWDYSYLSYRKPDEHDTPSSTY